MSVACAFGRAAGPRSSPEAAAQVRSIRETLQRLDPGGELIVVGDPPGGIDAVTARVRPGGFGPATRAGLEAARGDYVLTLDAHATHAADVAARSLGQPRSGEIVVASRYVDGARVAMSVPRRLASRAVNKVFGRGLSLPVTDLSSAFRLYRGDVLRSLRLEATDYDLLPELLVRALRGGLARGRDPAAHGSLAPEPGCGAAAASRPRLRAHVRLAVAAAQLDRGRRLRRARARQHYPAAALLAAPAAQAHHRADRGAGPGAATSAAGRARSSPRCRKAASRSTSCPRSCATRGVTACRSSAAPASRCRLPTPRSRASSVRR